MENLKLSVELVPSSCWWSNVRSHVTQTEWDSIRKDCYALAHYQCEVCGGKGRTHPVECHEQWAYDLKTKTQKLVKFVALCPSCHEVKHMGLAQLNGRFGAAIAWFMKINRVDRQTAMVHTERAFSEWQQKSEMDWKLDVGYLSKYGITVEKTDRGQRKRND